MQILSDVYNSIINRCPPVPPENGGILGGADGIVSKYVSDKGLESNLYNEYIPNVDFLNSVICEWQNRQIQFYGIYHSHFQGGYDLSDADKQYITKIMENIPYRKLFFPIVFPREGMLVYRAEFVKKQLRLSRESLILIN